MDRPTNFAPIAPLHTASFTLTARGLIVPGRSFPFPACREDLEETEHAYLRRQLRLGEEWRNSDGWRPWAEKTDTA